MKTSIERMGGALALVMLGMVGCARSNGAEPGSETHFLTSCETDAECEPAYACECGQCTLACEDDALCQRESEDAVCTLSTRDDCQTPAKRVCVIQCTQDGDCSALGANGMCDEGQCRALTPVVTPMPPTPPVPTPPTPPRSPEEQACADALSSVFDQPRACAAEPGSGHNGALSLSGTVTDVSRGGLDQCSYPEQGDRPWQMSISDGMDSLGVGFFLPWRMPLVSVGDRVAVEYDYLQGGFGPDAGSLTLRTEEGELIAWIGLGASVDSLEPPEGITLADGPAACSIDEDCGAYEKRAIMASLAAETQEIAYAQAADLGPFVVLHAGNEQTVRTGGPNGVCPDWFRARASVVVLRGSLDALSATDRGPCGDTSCADGSYCVVPEAADCDRTDSQAECAAMPDSCEEDCPGVCGCDGHFYCNACHAARAGATVAVGDTSCMTAGCDDTATATDGGDQCWQQWRCFGDFFETTCTQVDGGRQCTCTRNSQVVETVPLPPANTLVCGAEDVVRACGFPLQSEYLLP